MQAGLAEYRRRLAREADEEQEARQHYVRKMQGVIDAYLTPRMPPARPWLPQAQARLAAAQQAERAAVRAASFGQITTEAVARAQTETRDAQHTVDQLARSLAARLVADGIQIAGPQAAGVYA